MTGARTVRRANIQQPWVLHQMRLVRAANLARTQCQQVLLSAHCALEGHGRLQGEHRRIRHARHVQRAPIQMSQVPPPAQNVLWAHLQRENGMTPSKRVSLAASEHIKVLQAQPLASSALTTRTSRIQLGPEASQQMLVNARESF